MTARICSVLTMGMSTVFAATALVD